jgi:lipopolysaccharide biosynthesis protein
MFTLLIHIYYQDSWEKIFKHQLKDLECYSPGIMVNLCITHPGNSQIISAIKNDFPNAFIITTPNKGKDIGGKLALIDFFNKTQQAAEYIVFLHDKVSPYSITGERWRTKLFSIVDAGKVKTILNDFSNNPRLGIVGAKDFIRNEFDEKKSNLETTNSDKIKELIAKYNLKISSFIFIAGTMFWIRSSIIRNFFSVHSPLDCREMLEDGGSIDHQEGTYTHSWERILCWLANDQQYTIKGI